MVLMNRGILLLVVLLSLTSSVFADVIHAKQSKNPAPQDSVFETPSAPDPAPRETDAGRWVIPLREVMQRTYDVSGQKSEWVLGTSILGSPELPATSLGIGSLSKRYPSKLAGIYTTRLSFDASTLSLNGENGILFEERHGIPVDTPITDVNWERGAFEGQTSGTRLPRQETERRCAPVRFRRGDKWGRRRRFLRWTLFDAEF